MRESYSELIVKGYRSSAKKILTYNIIIIEVISTWQWELDHTLMTSSHWLHSSQGGLIESSLEMSKYLSSAVLFENWSGAFSVNRKSVMLIVIFIKAG